ncbi:MAG: dTMP kinase [Thermodesulfobacteriota bacterium]|nr:dTMP kinase [Thermodesulfobacteriota bacterium]
MFITFEGIEGSGKTTQISFLDEFLTKKRLPYMITREPGGTNIGEELRRILLSSQSAKMEPLTELFLYMATRAQHVQEIIKPALADGKIVICDRFSDASIAYQVYARGFDVQLVKQMNEIATLGLTPDITILLDCPVDTGLTRAMERISLQTDKGKEDRFEREDKSFHKKVREGYLKIAQEEHKRVIVIDGTKGKDTIHKDICDFLLSRIIKGRKTGVV